MMGVDLTSGGAFSEVTGNHRTPAYKINNYINCKLSKDNNVSL